MRRSNNHTFTMSPIARAGLAGLGDDYTGTGYAADNWMTAQNQSAAWPDSAGGSLDPNALIQMAKDLGIAYLAYDQQKMLQEVNLERVRRGQPIIPMSAIAPQVQFGLSNDTLMYLAIGGGLLLVLMMAGRRRH